MGHFSGDTPTQEHSTLGSDADREIRKLRRSGKICFILGILMLANGVAIFVMFEFLLPASAYSGGMYYFRLTLLGAAALLAVLGVGLFAGGIGVIRLKGWAYKPIVAVIVILMVAFALNAASSVVIFLR